MQALQIFHPVERNVVIGPVPAHRDRNLVGVLALERPVVDRSDVLDDVHGMDMAIGLYLDE